MNVDCFGSGARFHHIGVAVHAIRDVYPGLKPTHDAAQGVNVAFISMNGCDMELIEPAGVDSPISASLKHGIKLLHLCYEVDNLEEALRHCRQHGFHIIRQPVPASAFAQRRIAFVMSRTFGLVELLESGEEG